MDKLGLPERFWDKVLIGKPDECWIWCGPITPNGYGTFNNNPPVGAHRAALIAKTGKKGECACHSCDFPACVNPRHLYWGTQKENIKDCIGKGRRDSLIGDNNDRSKLSNTKLNKLIKEFNSLIQPNGIRRGVDRLCKKYGVSSCYPYKVLEGKLRTHLKGV